MKKIICLDIDRTLCDKDKWHGLHYFGDLFEGATEFVKKLSQVYEIHIYTKRCNLEANRSWIPGNIRNYDDLAQKYLVDTVKKWLDKHGIPHDKVLTNKPDYKAVIDDKAYQCRPKENKDVYNSILQELVPNEIT